MTRPIRVLWVIKGLGPGGAEHLLLELARAADPAAVTYEAAYLLPWKDHLVAELADAGVASTCLDAPHPMRLRWLNRLRRLITRGRFDIVHSHSPALAAPTRLLLRTLPGRTRPRHVYTEHNTWQSHRAGTRAANAVTSPLDDARLAVSDAVRNSMWRRLRDGVDVMVQGIAVDEVRAERSARDEVRAELGVPPDAVVVGTVANLRDNKDYPTLLAAARVVLDRCPHARFVAVGQGPLEDDIRALHEQLGLGERFQLLGYRPDARRILAACDVFTLASREEGLPVALMEAMALGLPVVATAVGGVPDVIRPGIEGELVAPGNANVLAAAIVTLVDDAELRQRLARASSLRGGEFDIKRAARQLEGRYRELVD